MEPVSCASGEWTHPASGHTLTYRLWRPAAPRMLLVLVHGFAEHGGRYAAFAESLAARGICVAVPDLWAHGRSGGERGDLGDPAHTVRDLQALTAAVFLPQTGFSRYSVYGHSFGGLIAVLWGMANDAALGRLVVQSPLFEVAFELPWWKTVPAWVLAACWPKLRFEIDLDAGALSHNPAVAEAYRNDPLVHHAMSAGTYRALLQRRDEAMAGASRILAPILLLLAQEDRVVSVDAARRWFEQVAAEKRLVEFPGCYHELHHEQVREDILRLAADWVLADAER